MRYVIIRDDDTNAFTPPEFLERLYRPFLDSGMPVNLAIIPDVDSGARTMGGAPEGFLAGAAGEKQVSVAKNGKTHSIASNPALVRYLKDNSGYSIVQHGCHHDPLEFNRAARGEIVSRLDRGTRLLLEAGFDRPQTFVAPYDKLSRAALEETALRFRVLSTGWYELRRLPYSWWPQYALKKMRQAQHWRIGRTLLLSHPGCLLSYHRSYSAMLGPIAHCISTRRLTVLVTHWWEYFRDGAPDEPFIDVLHETAAYLARCPDLKVIRFADLVDGNVPLN